MKKLIIIILVLNSCTKEPQPTVTQPTLTPIKNCKCGTVIQLNNSFREVLLTNECSGNFKWVQLTDYNFANTKKYQTICISSTW